MPRSPSAHRAPSKPARTSFAAAAQRGFTSIAYQCAAAADTAGENRRAERARAQRQRRQTPRARANSAANCGRGSWSSFRSEFSFSLASFEDRSLKKSSDGGDHLQPAQPAILRGEASQDQSGQPQHRGRDRRVAARAAAPRFPRAAPPRRRFRGGGRGPSAASRTAVCKICGICCSVSSASGNARANLPEDGARAHAFAHPLAQVPAAPSSTDRVPDRAACPSLRC